jgi:SAM-dependent methyltransferase
VSGHPALERYLAGAGSPAMALMALAIESPDAAALSRAIAAARAETASGTQEDRRLRRLADLHAAHPDAHALVRRVLAAVPHDRAGTGDPATLARIAAAFDAAAGVSPEASVALYSLGDADLLAASTVEIADRMRTFGVAAPGRRMLEIGCGIGRFAAALSGTVGAYVGVDISRRMVEEARTRCAGLADARFLVAAGHALPFPDASFDAVFAVDAFPYVVQAGGDLPARTFAEAGRLTRPGGDLLILNYAYRDDPAADRGEVERLGKAAGFDLVATDAGAFATWDGSLFRLSRR